MKPTSLLHLKADDLLALARTASSAQQRAYMETILAELSRRTGKAAKRAMQMIAEEAGAELSSSPVPQPKPASGKSAVASKPLRSRAKGPRTHTLFELRNQAHASMASQDYEELERIQSQVRKKPGVLAEILFTSIAVYLWGEGVPSNSALDHLR